MEFRGRGHQCISILQDFIVWWGNASPTFLMLFCVFSDSVIISQPNSLMDQGPRSLSLCVEWIWKLQPVQVPPKVLFGGAKPIHDTWGYCTFAIIIKSHKKKQPPSAKFPEFSISFLSLLFHQTKCIIAIKYMLSQYIAILSRIALSPFLTNIIWI